MFSLPFCMLGSLNQRGLQFQKLIQQQRHQLQFASILGFLQHTYFVGQDRVSFSKFLY